MRCRKAAGRARQECRGKVCTSLLGAGMHECVLAGRWCLQETVAGGVDHSPAPAHRAAGRGCKAKGCFVQIGPYISKGGRTPFASPGCSSAAHCALLRPPPLAEDARLKPQITGLDPETPALLALTPQPVGCPAPLPAPGRITRSLLCLSSCWANPAGGRRRKRRASVLGPGIILLLPQTLPCARRLATTELEKHDSSSPPAKPLNNPMARTLEGGLAAMSRRAAGWRGCARKSHHNGGRSHCCFSSRGLAG